MVDDTTLHVRGRLDGSLDTRVRALPRAYPRAVGQELDLFYLPRAKGEPQEQEEDVELSDHEVVVGYYDGGPTRPGRGDARADRPRPAAEAAVPRRLPRALPELRAEPEHRALRLPARPKSRTTRASHPCAELFGKN